MLSILIVVLLIILLFERYLKNKERKEKSKRNTKIENYLWIIRLLKTKGYNLKDKSGLNTPHVVLIFEGPHGKIIKLDHDYTVLNENQGKIFLISDGGKMEINFIQTKKREEEITEWLETK